MFSKNKSNKKYIVPFIAAGLACFCPTMVYAATPHVAVSGVSEETSDALQKLEVMGCEAEVVNSDIDASDYDALVIPGGADLTNSVFGIASPNNDLPGYALSNEQIYLIALFRSKGKPVYLVSKDTQVANTFFSSGIATAEENQTKIDETNTSTQAISMLDWEWEDVIALIGPKCTQNQAQTGILASVTMAQFILESGCGKTDLAVMANNCFGMKAELSANNWEGSTWDGSSIYTKASGEEYGGSYVMVVSDFRKYDCIEDSIADHSAYLLHATNGSGLRYAGLVGETDYRTAIQIIKNGGYATDSAYVSKICSLIERYNLTQYDLSPEEMASYDYSGVTGGSGGTTLSDEEFADALIGDPEE